MKPQRTLLALGGIGGMLLAGTLVQSADLQPAIVTELTGTLRVRQGIPCGGTVDRTTPVTDGRIELTPAEGIATAGGGRYFALTRADLVFDGFSATGSCLGLEETRTYDDIRVQLRRAVSFTASPTPSPGIFAVTIPASAFSVEYVTTVNGELETGIKQPGEPVTGTIDLATGALQMRVVLATRATFRALCSDLGCLIDETHDGSLVANLAGRMAFPDSDGDGVADRSDNCRFVANADQTPVPTPSIAPPPPITLASCLSRGFGVAAAADVCNGSPVTVSSNAPSRFDLGANVVTWRAQDAAGRTATATQTVTVVDRTPPSFTSVPPNLSMTNCGPAALGLPTASDDCAGAPAFSNDAPPTFSVGVTPVTWTARDVSGNIRTAVQTVTVTDTVAPAVNCVPTQPTGNSFRVSSSDACSGSPTLRLGSFVLAEGETIMINETGRPGVRLVNTVGAGRVRHFQVGSGEATITAADESGNVAATSCPVR